MMIGPMLSVRRLHEHGLQRVRAHLVGLRERELATLVHCVGVEADFLGEVDQRDDDCDRADDLANRSPVLQRHGVLPKITGVAAGTGCRGS
jgi:hypothetical protein